MSLTIFRKKVTIEELSASLRELDEKIRSIDEELVSAEAQLADLQARALEGSEPEGLGRCYARVHILRDRRVKAEEAKRELEEKMSAAVPVAVKKRLVELKNKREALTAIQNEQRKDLLGVFGQLLVLCSEVDGLDLSASLAPHRPPGPELLQALQLRADPGRRGVQARPASGDDCQAARGERRRREKTGRESRPGSGPGGPPRASGRVSGGEE